MKSIIPKNIKHCLKEQYFGTISKDCIDKAYNCTSDYFGAEIKDQRITIFTAIFMIQCRPNIPEKFTMRNEEKVVVIKLNHRLWDINKKIPRF